MPPKYTVVQTKIDSNEEFAKICGDDAEMNFLQDRYVARVGEVKRLTL